MSREAIVELISELVIIAAGSLVICICLLLMLICVGYIGTVCNHLWTVGFVL